MSLETFVSANRLQHGKFGILNYFNQIAVVECIELID